jgi:hypothetical protein
MNWESRLREMLLAGGSLALAACGHNAEAPDPGAPDGSESDDGGSDAGIATPDFCCNANPDPCCPMLCGDQGQGSAGYNACQSALTACDMQWNTFSILGNGTSFECTPIGVPSNFSLDGLGQPSCGGASCAIGPGRSACCIDSVGQSDCVDGGTACPSTGSSYECIDRNECVFGNCCATVDLTSGAVTAACVGSSMRPTSCAELTAPDGSVSDASTPDAFAPDGSAPDASASDAAGVEGAADASAPDAAFAVPAPLCQQNVSCAIGQTCLWQDCTLNGRTIQLTMCGLQSGPPLHCVPHSASDAGGD